MTDSFRNFASSRCYRSINDLPEKGSEAASGLMDPDAFRVKFAGAAPTATAERSAEDDDPRVIKEPTGERLILFERFTPNTLPNRQRSTAWHAEKVLEAARQLQALIDPEFERAVKHEAGHALMGLACQWRVEFCDARTAETRVHEPDNFYNLSHADRDWQRALVFNGAEALSGLHSQHEYNGDRHQTRLHAHGVDPADAVTYIRKFASDPAVQDLYRRLCDALMAKGRLEERELLALWNGE